MRILRILDIFMFFSKLFCSYLQQFLICYVIERIQSFMSTMLQRLSVLDFQWLMINFFLNNLSFSHLYLLLPSTLTVELFIIFAEIKTSVVQTFIEVFSCYFLTCFLKFHSTSSQLNKFLSQTRKNDRLSNIGMWTSHHDPNNFSSVQIRNDLEDQRVTNSFAFLNNTNCCF